MASHLLVTNDYLPKTGGIQVYLHELWRRLDAGRAVVLTATSHPRAAQFDEDCDVVIERVAEGTLFAPQPRALRAIEEAIARHQPEIVLLDPAWPLGLLGPRLSRPYGVILHGAEVAIPGRLPVASSSMRYILRHAAVAVCAGSYPEAEARRVAGADMPPVIQIPPGVDVERFSPISSSRRREVRENFGFAESDLVVASYSRLVPRKGMDTLIRAAAQLRGSLPELVVAIGGSGRDRERLEKLAHHENAPVRFLGRVSDDDLPGWIAASDLMVMDCRSRWLGLEQEGFGIVFAEAAACGVAQIAGRSGGSHDAVEHGVTGMVVDDPSSSGDLATAMAKLLGDADLRGQLGSNARRHAESTFSWTLLAERLGRELETFDRYRRGDEG